MMTDPVTDYLIQEIKDLLGAGSVGLYEFPQSVLVDYPALSTAEQVRHSKLALQELIENGEAYLVWEVWARHDLQRRAIDVEPSDSDFAFPWPAGASGDKPYLAIEPVVGPRPQKKHFWSRNPP